MCCSVSVRDIRHVEAPVAAQLTHMPLFALATENANLQPIFYLWKNKMGMCCYMSGNTWGNPTSPFLLISMTVVSSFFG